MIDTSTKAAMVEEAAKARCKNWPKSPDGCAPVCMDRSGGVPKSGCIHALEVHGSKVRIELTAAIIAAEARGFKLVGRETTGEMDIAARDWSKTKFGQPIGSDASRGCWRCQHAAAPKWGDGE